MDYILKNLLVKLIHVRLIVLLLILLLLKVTYNIVRKKKTDFKEGCKYLFIIYIVFIFYVVIIKKTSWSGFNIVPFKEIFRYSFGSFLFYKNVVGNIVMFIPYGFFIGYFCKLNVLKEGIIILLTSLNIEIIQLIIGRVFDVDDVILNLIGGLIGYYVYYFLKKLVRKWQADYKND